MRTAVAARSGPESRTAGGGFPIGTVMHAAEAAEASLQNAASDDALRACGLSNAKIRALRAVAEAAVEGGLDLARLGDLIFTVIDTAGLEEAKSETLPGRMRAQTEAAIAAADAVFFLIDARAGVMPADRVFPYLLRKTGKPIILVANKTEGRSGTAGALEAFALGLGEPVAISAEHGEGLAGLYEALRTALPDATALPSEGATADAKPDAAEKPIRIAVQNGRVELYGTVDSQADRETAFVRANGVFGVFSVENDLQVANQPAESR